MSENNEHNYDVAIIGGGVVGSATARELSRWSLRICVLEKELDVCNGVSGRNTGLLHSGILNEKGLFRTECCLEGNAEFDRVSTELGVPFRRCGKLIVGFGEEERIRLEALYRRGLSNHIPGLRWIDRDGIKALEPNADGDFAIHVPSAGVLCPFTYTIALAENAAQNGVDYHFDREVTNISREKDGMFRLETTGGEYRARWSSMRPAFLPIVLQAYSALETTRPSASRANTKSSIRKRARSSLFRCIRRRTSTARSTCT